MADTTQPPTTEASWLRQHWNRESLEKFENQWIAVKNTEIISHASSLDSVLSQTITLDPLYAFVYFGPLQ